MATPIEQGVAVAIAAPSLALLFTFWPFGLSFVASCVALIYLTSTSLNIAVKNIVGATLIGGALSQLSALPVITICTHFYPELTHWAETAEMPVIALLAIIIGLLTQKLLPKILDRIAKEIDGI